MANPVPIRPPGKQELWAHERYQSAQFEQLRKLAVDHKATGSITIHFSQGAEVGVEVKVRVPSA